MIITRHCSSLILGKISKNRPIPVYIITLLLNSLMLQSAPWQIESATLFVLFTMTLNISSHENKKSLNPFYHKKYF